jgi:3-hydroxyisobutyrate dehydrogenase-like beta-hydroxyacid dehydrogenase
MIGLVGAGYMGSGLAVSLMRGGHEVATSLAGRSDRTHRFVSETGMAVLPDLALVVASAEFVLLVTPPGVALDAARDIAAATGTTANRPLVVDLNAIAPDTVRAAADVLAAVGFDLVDGSISGPPPTLRAGARIFLSGPRAAEVAALRWRDVTTVLLEGPIGQASAVKMCTASIQKGLAGIVTQALRAADAFGVLDTVVAELGHFYADPVAVATAAAKADRYVGEMHEIAAAQRAAGLTPELFEAFAAVYADVADTALAAGNPEDVVDDSRPLTEVMTDLRSRRQ